MSSLSAVIITLNAGHIIEKTLKSLTWCNEIIVVDSGSTDETVEICNRYGCKVSFRTFDGYGPQKNYANSLATSEWILSIDADEVLEDSARIEIQEYLAENGKGYSAFFVPVTLLFMGRIFRHGKEFANPKLRLFKKQCGKFTDAQVHEKLEVTGEIKHLKNGIIHYSYKDVHQYLHKLNHYTTSGAESLFARGKRKSSILLVVSLPFYFIRHYFFSGNVRNGFPGFVWAVLSTLYSFVKYAKLKEMYALKK